MSSASMMTEAVKGHSLGEAMQMSQEFTKMMLGEDYNITEDMGDVEALQGVSQFPARIKCATLAWKALEKGTVQKKVKQKVQLKNKIRIGNKCYSKHYGAVTFTYFFYIVFMLLQ